MVRSSKAARLSPLYSDLGMPIFPDRGTASRFANASQAATASALWRDTGISADIPAPPVFTLDDRIRFFGLGDLPSDRTGSLSPSASSSSSSFVRRTRAEMSGSGAAEVHGEERETGRGSPIDGLIEPGALITPPPPRPREIVKPGSHGCSMQNRGLGSDEWITVYGYTLTFLFLLLFEFCFLSVSLAFLFPTIAARSFVLSFNLVVYEALIRLIWLDWTQKWWRTCLVTYRQ